MSQPDDQAADAAPPPDRSRDVTSLADQAGPMSSEPGDQPPPWAPPDGWVWAPEPVQRGRTALVMLAIAAAVAVLGVPFGLLWTAVAPEVPIIMTDGGPVYGAAQPEQQVAADGWFAILALPVGLLAAAGVWWLARPVRGLPGLVAVTVGAVGTGLLAWWVGRQIGLADYESTLAAAEAGAELDQPPDLAVVEFGWWPPQVLGVLLVPALAAAAAYTMLAAWSRFPSLRPEPVTEDPLEAA